MLEDDFNDFSLEKNHKEWILSLWTFDQISIASFWQSGQPLPRSTGGCIMCVCVRQLKTNASCARAGNAGTSLWGSCHFIHALLSTLC